MGTVTTKVSVHFSLEVAEKADRIIAEIEDKLKRTTTEKSEVVVDDAEPLGDLRQYKVEARAYISQIAMPPPNKILEADLGQDFRPFRVIASVVHTDIIVALTQLNDIVK